MDAATEVQAACSMLGLQQDIQVVSVNGFRWTLAFDQSTSHPDFAMSMIKLERLLQERTGRPIDLRLEPLPDKNKRQVRNVLWGKDEPGN